MEKLIIKRLTEQRIVLKDSRIIDVSLMGNTLESVYTATEVSS